ncbi:hypothetical protein [Desulfurobacterium atlanticum]|uniref:SH3 domain-containing protein n=1 Tax=Desulfurobacterium atlanticum TaxID=240169 RepID=A0A238ZUH1_9BACT|nr:hypothetical protein [Desulfurobacterium atlanticum]SNR86303.1 hypothetical protein SAMN06265340_11146 [Desulfurobacterium atlanticum]
MKNLLIKMAAMIFIGVVSAKATTTAQVMIDSISIRKQPEGEIVGTLDKNTEITYQNRYNNWINTSSGWLNSDFTKLSPQNSFLFTEKIEGTFTLIEESLEGVSLYGKEILKEGSIFPVIKSEKGITIIEKKGEKIAVPTSKIKIEKGTFPAGIILKNGTLISEKGKTLSFIKEKTPFIKIGNFIAVNGKFGNFIPITPKVNHISASSILSKVNILVDTFNSARISSAITERLGYFPKVLPITPEDIHIVNLEEERKGVFLNIKYMFYDLDGSKMKDRKTRLILKRGNEVFWEKVSKEVFSLSPSVKFVQINIFRYDGKGNFEKKGFVAVGITDFKKGICDAPPEKFMEKTESELSEDLWFFANEVYERVENGN